MTTVSTPAAVQRSCPARIAATTGHESEECSEWSDCAEDVKAKAMHCLARPKAVKGIEQDVVQGFDEGSTTAISGDEVNQFLSISTSESELEEGPRKIWSLLCYSRKTLLAARGSVSGTVSVRYTAKSIQDLSKAFPKTQGRSTESSKPAITRHGEDERFARSVRAALADFAPCKCVVVCQLLASRGARTAVQFCTVLSEVFDKGYNSHALIPACVDLCLQLRDNPRFEPAIGAEGGPHSFRQCVLDQVWPSFHRLLEAKNCTSTAQKRCAVGVAKMISELILRNVVSPRLLVECSELLCAKAPANPCALDSLAALILVGPRLNLQGWTHWPRLESVLRQLQELVTAGAVPVPTRMALKESLASYQHRDLHLSANTPLSMERSGEAMLQIAKSALLCSEETTTSVPLKKQLRPEAPAAVAVTSASVSKHSSSLQEMLARSANSKKKTPDGGKLVFNPVAFHRELSVTLRQLSLDGDVDKAVAKVLAQQVPIDKQGKEFADLLTRACEMSREVPRQAAFALAASIAASDPGVFDHDATWTGTELFFDTVYPELCAEVPKLPLIVRTELLPALRTVFPSSLLENISTTTVG